MTALPSVNSHPNVTAYDGVEAAGNFPDAAALANYRAAALERSRLQVEYIGARVGEGLHMFEVGAGNGRLGFAAARAGVAATFHGIDLAQSRVDFARAWARQAGAGMVRVEQGDAFSYDPQGRFDLVACITGAFGYFDAIRPGGGCVVLNRLAACCRAEGYLLLELYMHGSLKARCLKAPNQTVREWDRLPESDPFQYYLHECTFESVSGLLTHHKIFVPRNPGSPCDARTEILKLYEPSEITALLDAAGFLVRSMDAWWDGRPYESGSDVLILLAQKVGR